MITKLTEEQEKDIQKYYKEGIEIGLDTNTDKQKSEEAIGKLYEFCGYERPVIWWCRSPYEMQIMINVLKNNNILENIWVKIGNNIKDNIRNNIGDNIEGKIWANIGDNIDVNITHNIGNNIKANIKKNIEDNIAVNIRKNIGTNTMANIRGNISANIGDNIKANIRNNIKDHIKVSIENKIWDNIRKNIIVNIKNNIKKNIEDNLLNNIGANIWANIKDNIAVNIKKNIEINISHNTKDKIVANIWYNIADNIWDNIRFNIGDNIENNISVSIGTNILNNINDNIDVNITHNIDIDIWNTIEPHIENHIKDNILHNIKDNIKDNMEVYLFYYGYAQNEIYWIQYCRYFINNFSDINWNEKSILGLQIMYDICKYAGWWFPFSGIVFMCEKPIENNYRNKFHRTDGPVIKYSDGYCVYGLNNMWIPSFVFKDKEEIDIQDIIKIKNVEQKREIIKFLGEDWFFGKLNGKLLHTKYLYLDENQKVYKNAGNNRRPIEYRLIEADIGLSEKIKILCMDNASMEGEKHYEIVEPKCKTVLDAFESRTGVRRYPVYLS